MASPDTYLKFCGDEYFRAVSAYSNHVQLGYLKALWYYRSHNHCKGLENDSEQLRRICEIEKENWTESEKVIFGSEFFTLDENGLWQQIRAQIDYAEDKLKLEKWKRRGLAGANGRWRKKRK